MQFKVKDWRYLYDSVQRKGARLKDSRSYVTKNGFMVPAKNPLDINEQKELESEIEGLLERSKVYLDLCGMKISKPLWVYDSKDPSTWKSHESFKYADLIK